MNLSNKIYKFLKNRNLQKPKMITNSDFRDILVEQDLLGKDLYELKKETIKLLSADLQIFNDEAFRYYLPQFIYFCVKSTKFVIEDMFIQVFFRSNLLNEKTQRFLQFTDDERIIIIEFLQKIYNKICKVTDTNKYKNLQIWEQEDIIIPFKAYKIEIKQAIKFWDLK